MSHLYIEWSLDDERPVVSHVLHELVEQPRPLPVSPADPVVSPKSSSPRPDPVGGRRREEPSLVTAVTSRRGRGRSVEEEEGVEQEGLPQVQGRGHCGGGEEGK
jgi:hypothetical protein